MERTADRVLDGSLAGIGATVVMSAFMLAARRIGWVTKQAPSTITERAVEDVTHRPARDGAPMAALTAVLHLLFGAVAGALYAGTLGRVRTASVPPALTGAVYGTGIWATSYWGVLPALGLMPTPPRDQRRRPLTMLIAHWIFGAALALLTPTPPPPEPAAGRPPASAA